MRAALILLALACAGCHQRSADTSGEPADPAVYRDRVTGCEYLTKGHATSSLTPRMDADGKQVCTKLVTP
jgi:hypothetical protein